jgi:hypothetical protein
MPIEDLYPHTPPPIAAPTNGFGSMNPAGIAGLAQTIQDVQGKQGVAEAYRRNVGPDGVIDQPGLIKDLGQMGGIHAGAAIGSAISNANQNVAYGAAKVNALGNAFSSLTGVEKPSKKDVYDLSARMSVSGIPASDIKKYQDFILSGGSPDGIKRNAAVVGNQVLGQGAGELVQGGYNPSTMQPVLVPKGQLNTRGATGGVVTQPMSGAPEAVGEGQKTLAADREKSAVIGANVRPLEAALPLIKQLSHINFGPGSEGFNHAKQGLITIGVIPAGTSDVMVREEVNKYVKQYASGAAQAGRSDMALGTALGSNPNLDLTQPANINLVRNQISRDKMDAALPHVFKVEHPMEQEEADYLRYKGGYYNRMDQRVFAYDKLDPQERRDFIKSLGPKDSPSYKKFNRGYEFAKAAGYISPEKQ